MSKELVISANRHETKVALIEDDQLVEVYFQRSNEYSLAGSIHKGRVTRVLPGMQSAFVDVGLERDTFLYVSDFLEEHDDFDKITGDERPVRDRERDRDRGRDRGRDRDRGPREQRDAAPSHRPPAQAPADEAAVIGVSPAATEGAAVTEPSAAAAAPSGERAANGTAPTPGGEREERERRGRRSRRRRRGGHGFPDSKYATDGPPAPRPAEAVGVVAPPVEPVAEAVAEPGPVVAAPIVLPGESLAKYRNAAPVNHAYAPAEPPELDI